MTKSAADRINPPAVVTTPLEDFRAQVRYFFDENVCDLAYDLIEMSQLLHNVQTSGIPDDFDQQVEKFGSSLHFANFLMEDGDVMSRIKKNTWLKDGLSQPHEGDCVAVPCACTRCHAEDYYGLVNSRSWGSKAEGWALYNQAKKPRDHTGDESPLV